MANYSVAGHELVHDSAAHTDEFILGALTDLRQFHGADRCCFRRRVGLGSTQQSEGGRNFDRRGRTQAGADGQFAPDEQVRPWKIVSRFLKHDCDSDHIITPCSIGGEGRIIQRYFGALVKVFRIQRKFAILAGSYGYPGV